MNKFHRKCGDRVTLFNQNLTAIRNFVEFNHGLVLSADPLIDDVLFEVRIDRKVNVWNGSLEIGVTTLDPEFLELPATATKLRSTAWILSGNSIVKDGNTILSSYGPELDSLRESDCIAVSRSSKGELMFFINGSCLGVAAKDLPSRLFAVIDLYGQCVQVSIIHCNYARTIMEPYVGTTSESATGGLVRTHRDTHIQLPLTCPLVTQDNLRFHPRCGILVKLSNNNKSAERARPLDDYNNGVVMTHRPLYDNECFEIRIDKLVDKWSGSIEVGVTTHNPATIRFPSTMTNMDTGTIMMSGCKVLMNGQGACMEYGNFNLDELREGDTVGMMRRGSGRLHYFINGVDQGVATDKVPPQVWGVVDLYGMTVKVTVVDPCEDLDSNINEMPVRMLAAAEAAESPDASPAPQPALDSPATAITMPEELPPFPSTSTYEPPPECAGLVDEEELLFHTLRDSHVIIINDGRTAHRPNAFEVFNNGFVMTNRTLKTNELFQVRLDLVIPKWAGSIEIGITQHSSNDIKLPFRMINATSGTWGITGEDVIQDGTIIIPQYVRNLTRLVEGDTVGVMRKDMGILHFFVNGVDQGPAAFNIPEHVFGIVDLYGRVAQATIVDTYTPPQVSSPESPVSIESNATVLPEMCFHRVHGHNARLSRNRLTASRVTVYSEFNDAVLFSSRPMRECDMFEIKVDKMIDCWIGSLEIGVTAIRPEDLDSNGSMGALAGTATDLSWDTYILSGSAMMKDGECVRSGYQLNLDTITVGSRVGMMWHADRSIHYYLDGMDMGKAWHVPHLNIYAVVDLYGQCTQVTILQNEERAFNYNGCNTDHAVLANPRAVVTPPQPYWSFSEYHGGNVSMSKDFTVARRLVPDPMGALVFSSAHLILGEMYEIQILECKQSYAGSFRIGVTDVNVLNAIVNRNLPLCTSWMPHFTAYIDGRYMKYTLPNSAEHDKHSFVPSFDWLRPGDRIGLKKTADSKVLVYYNSELLDIAFEKVPDKVYVLMEMYGPITKIQTVSRGTKILPGNQQTIPNDKPELQDVAGCLVEAVTTNTAAPPSVPTAQSDNQASETYEVADGPEPPTPPQSAVPEENVTTQENFEPAADDAECGVSLADYRPVEVESSVVARNTQSTEATETETRRRGALPYTFHYMTGNNIRLCSSDTVAVRYRGFADAVAVASQPLHRGQAFRFRVDRVTDEWQGTVTIGALAMLPSEMPPMSALHFTIPCWVVSNDVLYNRGVYTLSEVGRKLEEITENSVLTLHFRASSELTLEIDGVNRGVIATIPRRFNEIYPAIDLYGRILQVSILLHPHVLVSGTSLDLPMIEEHREDGEARDTTDLDSDEADREPAYNFPNLSFSDPDDEFSFRHEQDNPDLEYYPTDAVTYPNNISFYPENYSTNVGYKAPVVEDASSSNAVEDVSNANDDVSNANGDVSNVNDDVSNANDNISANVNDDVSNANDDVSANINYDVSNVNDDVSNVNDDVSNVNDDVSNVNDDVSNPNDDISTNVNDDVSNANEDVSANINYDVSNVNNDVSNANVNGDASNANDDDSANVNDDISGNDVDDVSSAVDDTSSRAVDDTDGHIIDDTNIANDELNVDTVTNNVIDVNQIKELAANNKDVEVELRGKLEPLAGPSSAPDALPTLTVHLGNNDANNKKIKAFKTSNKDRRSWPFKTSLHRSLPLRDDCTADNDLAAARGLKKSHSSQHFTQKLEAEFVSVDSDESSSGESIVNPLSLGSHIFDDDSDVSEEAQEVCDTNIRHNDRYPEANETVCSNDYDASDAIDDNFDNVFIDAMFLETNNMPDLNEEQSLSMDESTTTRRDDFWADGLTIENLHYLNGIICWDQRVTGARVEHRDWVFYSETNGNCEVMHLALKFWNQIVAPYSDMREVVTSGCVHCFCSNCSPDSDPLYGGWVRIERTRASEVECDQPVRMFWHVMRATITSALALSDVTLAEVRRPRSFCHEPSTSPALADTWMDEEGKPHQAALALDVDIGGREAESDRLIAYWIYLKSHASMLQEACEDVEDTVEDTVDDILEDTVDDIVAMFDDYMEETADGSDRLDGTGPDPSRSESTDPANPLQ